MRTRRAPLTKLLTPLLVVVLTAAACSSDGSSTDASDSTLTTSGESGSAGPSGGTDDSDDESGDTGVGADLDPTALIDSVIVQQSDLDAEYTYEVEPPDDSEPCEGAEDADAVYPPTEKRTVSFSSSHFFETTVAVFDNDDAAIDNYDHTLETAEFCSGQITPDPDTGELASNEVSDYAIEALGDTDDEGAFLGTVTSAAATFDVYVIHARVDNVVIATVGSDADAAVGFEKLMLARLNGTPEEPVTLPAGVPLIGPGDPSLGSEGGDTGDDTGDENYAPDVRTLVSGPLGADIDPAARDWINSIDDATINDLTTRSCAELTAAQTNGTSLEQAFLTIYIESTPEVQNALEPEQLGEAIGAMLFIGCPEIIPALGEEFETSGG